MNPKSRLPESARKLLVGELIGLNARVVNSANKESIGINGKVVDETMNTLAIESNGTERIISKKGSVFEFETNEGKTRVDGDKINCRPEDRTKKLWNMK